MSYTRGAGGSSLAGVVSAPAAAAAASPAASTALSLDDDDDMAQEPGGKKRKVPVPLVPGSDAELDTGRDGADRNPPRSAREEDAAPVPVPRRLPRSTGALLAAHRRKLFKERKASLVALYLDAQGAVEAAAKPAATKPAPTLPDVRAFERLLPALEDVGSWSPDTAGWRDGSDEPPVPRRSLERWRTGFARRKRLRADRVPIARGGWAPEGSFELDIPTEASLRARARARERAALVKLADQLRALVLATNKPKPPPAAAPEHEYEPQLPKAAQTDPPPPPSKKKPKKKKRATLANEGNPHHVDKYRPSRPVPQEDPFSAWPSHTRYLFPPSMRVLSARGEKPAQRPAEDEYICWSCEYALFYGAEAARKHAIKQRKAELRRREKLRARAYDVTHGRSRFHSHSSDGEDGEYDDDEDLDDDCADDDDEHGKCTCGRAIHRQAHEEEEAKPPDKAG